MGFKLPRRTAVLTFEGGDFAGAEVRVRLDLSIAEFIGLNDRLNAGDFGECPVILARLLESWNLERDDGSPLPAEAEGVGELPLAFVVEILRQLIRAQVQPAAPLEGPSSNGNGSAAPPLPMVSLSANRGS